MCRSRAPRGVGAQWLSQFVAATFDWHHACTQFPIGERWAALARGGMAGPTTVSRRMPPPCLHERCRMRCRRTPPPPQPPPPRTVSGKLTDLRVGWRWWVCAVARHCSWCRWHAPWRCCCCNVRTHQPGHPHSPVSGAPLLPSSSPPERRRASVGVPRAPWWSPW